MKMSVTLAGDAAIGFICTAWFGTGRHFPLLQDILKYVVDKGKSQVARDKVGEKFTGIIDRIEFWKDFDWTQNRWPVWAPKNPAG